MRRLIALLAAAALMLGLAAPAAYAGDTATNVALGLASFAVFSQLVGPFLYQSPASATPVYVYQPPPQVIYVPPPPVVVVEPPQQIVVAPGTPGYSYWHGGPPPWAGRWKKHWKWEDDD